MGYCLSKIVMLSEGLLTENGVKHLALGSEQCCIMLATQILRLWLRMT